MNDRAGWRSSDVSTEAIASFEGVVHRTKREATAERIPLALSKSHVELRRKTCFLQPEAMGLFMALKQDANALGRGPAAAYDPIRSPAGKPLFKTRMDLAVLTRKCSSGSPQQGVRGQL
ncbi:conserved hypothetical protein [Coccidioides posadasii str. Silveira]|uniref:Uncharacterized protein n=2 Tax=Coccidioides posadasii TaxID=199306 RepID=E9D631_COCPS|nr:conserved hypothetical protein [Coccidioides posadasii str. Silveira]KMM66243.1 hypothetical protein CPAG_02583 [Coccidioides posadasii RMSCC 3488]